MTYFAIKKAKTKITLPEKFGKNIHQQSADVNQYIY